MSYIAKAIPTKYNGILFRSRLEARWAYYFDLLKIKWIYEIEGFILSDGSKYLPDFYLPDFNCFCEIKPFKQKDPRWQLFVNERNDYWKNYKDLTVCATQLLLLFGKVNCDIVEVLYQDKNESEDGYRFICNLGGANIAFMPEGHKYHPLLWCGCEGGSKNGYDDGTLTEYCNMANSKRFEFLNENED